MQTPSWQKDAKHSGMRTQKKIDVGWCVMGTGRCVCTTHIASTAIRPLTGSTGDRAQRSAVAKTSQCFLQQLECLSPTTACGDREGHETACDIRESHEMFAGDAVTELKAPAGVSDQYLNERLSALWMKPQYIV